MFLNTFKYDSGHLNLDIKLAPITLFIGRNNTGKSTSIDAMMDVMIDNNIVYKQIACDNKNYFNDFTRISNTMHILRNKMFCINPFYTHHERSKVIILKHPEFGMDLNSQPDIADFIIELMKTGNQLIIETHSEGIFNRIRRRIAEKVINKNDVALYNFYVDDKAKSHVEQLFINDCGGVNHWRKGFFDTQDKELEAILEAI
jgi:predicted ATPase